MINKQQMIKNLVEIAYDIQSGKDDWQRNFGHHLQSYDDLQDFKDVLVNTNKQIIKERMIYIIHRIICNDVYFGLKML